MDPLDAQIRQVFFFETPDLALNKAGVVVRARRVQGKGNDSVVKLRPVVPAELPEELRKSPNLGVEVDAMPGGFVCSASFKAKLPPTAVRDTILGGKPLRKLFSKEQREFFDANAPESIELDELSVLGPIFVLKLKWSPREFGRPLVAELWLYPDGSRILELSTKCATAEPVQVAAEARAFLIKKGVDLRASSRRRRRRRLSSSRRSSRRRTPSAALPCLVDDREASIWCRSGAVQEDSPLERRSEIRLLVQAGPEHSRSWTASPCWWYLSDFVFVGFRVIRESSY